ncbi:hypothetical protein GO988_04900 [Hymenobacter sp. HMF4947]|uniref:Porin n=1 Tax=Hymenobacter ginkgonis TaxID=2682976 RepID=A0A7K1TBA0_9BACT|nr:hypothetical protein [Hymenobacter ginkgonis]MVN75659.1 hypothetical protein [Hymenobacter ginkgonis]
MHKQLTLVVTGLFLAAILAMPVRAAWAQTPFRTAKSDGSIVLNTGGLVQASLEEALFRVGYVVNNKDKHAAKIRQQNNTKQVHGGTLYGFEVQGRPSDNLASLFSNNRVTAGTQATFSFGVANLLSHQPSAKEIPGIVAGAEADTGPTHLKSLDYDWLTLQVTYSRNSSTLYTPTNAYADQFSRKVFDGYGVQLAYNLEFKSNRIPMLLGLAPGIKRVNNINDLDKIQVEETRTITSPDGLTQRTTTVTRSGLRGTYEETTQATLNSDFVFYPFLLAAPRKASVAFNVFTRSALGDNGYFIPGVGAFVTAPKAPLKVYGGVSIYRDKNKEAAVDIVAGFGF